MIAILAIESGIPPSVLVREDPTDLWTMIDILAERGRRS